MAKTVQDIITMARNRTDMVNPTTGVVDGFFNDTTELIPYINSSAGELYDLLVGTYEDYRLTTAVLTITGTNNYTNLPTDFFHPRGCDVFIDSVQPYSVREFNFQERNRFANTVFRGPSGPYNVKFRCQDGYFFIEPLTCAPGTYTLWYTPIFTEFVASTDVIPAYMSNQSWFEYIVLDVAIKMKDKLELDSSAYERKKEPLRQRILAMSKGRAQATGKTISRIRYEADDASGWFGGNGSW